MKRYLGIILGVFMVVAMVSTVYAEVTMKFGGDARVRGIWQNNYDFDSDVDNDKRYYDHRVRLKVTAKVDDVEVRSRIVLIDGKWGKNYKYDNNGNREDVNKDGVVNEEDMVEQYNRTVTTDYAYLHVPVGSVTIDAGRYPIMWGNKFLYWDVKKDLIMATTKAGDAVVGGFVAKENELLQGDNGGDKDMYTLLGVKDFGSIKAGLLGIYENDDDKSQSGTTVDAFLKGSVGGLGVAGEVAVKSGDLNEDAKGNSAYGGFVLVSKGMDALTVGGAFAYAANKYKADKHFTPTVFFGTDQPTAVMDFKATDDATTWAVVAFANYKVSDKLTVGGAGAYASLGGMSKATGKQGDDASATEVDVRLKYKLAKKTTYSIDFGYLIPSDLTDNDDPAMALAHKLEIKF